MLTLSLATLGMHIYWFSGWVKKYFFTQNTSEKSEKSEKLKTKTKSKKSKVNL
jgi:hypothetical protein